MLKAKIAPQSAIANPRQAIRSGMLVPSRKRVQVLMPCLIGEPVDSTAGEQPSVNDSNRRHTSSASTARSPDMSSTGVQPLFTA